MRDRPLVGRRERFGLPDPGHLLDRLTRGARRARRAGECLVGLTWELPADVDPSAIAFASRRPGEPWFCFEQPDRDRRALAAIGAVAVLEDRGPERFHRVAGRWRALAAGAVADPPAGGPGAGGLVACGGFAFAPDGGASPHWQAFAPASLVVPEVAISRANGEVRITVAALLRPDDDPERILAALELRLAELRDPALPLLDPHPTERFRVAGAMAPEHYESAVGRAVERIRAGELEKVVLAREVDVHAPVAHDVAAVYGVLREAFGACFVFCAGRGDAAFIAASPELLIRRDGLRASTLALAGSARRSADAAVDDHLGEQLLHSAKDREEHGIVVRRIEQALRPHAVWVTKAPDPAVVTIANIQHLATPVRAQLRSPVGAVELAGLLHPTPAVGGEPHAAAARLIPALEGLDRGWYAGPVGWTDVNEDGEFCVALRCALVEDRLARCYAGVGVVADSDPAAELAETEIKLQALLPVLSG